MALTDELNGSDFFGIYDHYQIQFDPSLMKVQNSYLKTVCQPGYV